MRTFFLSIALVSCVPVAAGESVTLDAATQKRAGVTVEQVAEREFGSLMGVVGQVVRSPGSMVTVQSILPGRVEFLHATPGDTVRQGDVLVELHSHDLLALQGDVLRAGEAVKLAATRVEAGHQLFELGGISRLDLDLREQEAFSARLDFDAKRSELVDHGVSPAAVEQMLATKQTDPHLPVRAPVAGVVLELMTQEHEWVQEYAPLMTLGDPGRVELELQIPPDQAASVAQNDRVEFRPVGRSRAPGWATVVSRVPQVDPATRTVRVRARIDNGAEAFLPGVFVEGRLSHGEARRLPAIPEAAVIRMAGSDVVFVRTGAETFEARPVSLGMLHEEFFEVLSGISEGEEVAVSGVFLLKSTMVAGEGEED